MDVVTHHFTIAGDFAMTRSQSRIPGQDKDGKRIGAPSQYGGSPERRRRHLVLLHRSPFGADATWAVERPPQTD
jgi:hypothetical protein